MMPHENGWILTISGYFRHLFFAPSPAISLFHHGTPGRGDFETSRVPFPAVQEAQRKVGPKSPVFFTPEN